MGQAYNVRFRFTPQQRLDLRGVIVDECGGRVIAHSWEHAVLECASQQAAPLMPLILSSILRGDYDVTGDEGHDPRRPARAFPRERGENADGVKPARRPPAVPGPQEPF